MVIYFFFKNGDVNFKYSKLKNNVLMIIIIVIIIKKINK